MSNENKADVYIFTEIVNCGKIGKIALDSFHTHHNHRVHVYGLPEDFTHISPHQNNVLIPVTESIKSGYTRGHIGTALLWESVLKEVPNNVFIHFDSDVVFRDSIIDEMIEKQDEFDLIGPIRNYQYNPHHRNDIKQLADICQTNCTLFKKSFISPQYIKNNSFITHFLAGFLKQPLSLTARNIKWFLKRFFSKNRLTPFAQMIHGTWNPFPFPTLDFFDPVMFDMLQNGARIYHLDFNDVGGWNFFGSRDNAYKAINNFPGEYKLDYGKKLIHFSCVGSGMNFYLHPERRKGIGDHYVRASLDRYALFCNIFYNETLDGIPLEQYKNLIETTSWQ